MTNCDLSLWGVPFVTTVGCASCVFQCVAVCCSAVGVPRVSFSVLQCSGVCLVCLSHMCVRFMWHTRHTPLHCCVCVTVTAPFTHVRAFHVGVLHTCVFHRELVQESAHPVSEGYVVEIGCGRRR